MGPLDVVVDGGSLRLGGRKQRAVLAQLLLRAGNAVSREQLIDLVWGDESPRTADGSLQVYIHGLRRLLGADRIETSGRSYRLRAEPDELDLKRFESLAARARSALGQGRAADAADDLETALALWRGAALADLAGEPEVAAAAQALEEQRVEVLELRNDAHLDDGRHEVVLAGIDALIAEHPYRERFRAQQIVALYRAGRQTEALEAYRNARTTFDDELGIEPTPALQELERAVLRHDPSLAAPAARPGAKYHLPVPPTPLIGRRLEIAAVSALLRTDARLVTLVGPGGTGKTRLAVAVAADLAPELRDGAAFVDLSAISDPELLLPTIAHELGLEAAALLPAHLSERTMLLVLDNLEQIVEAAPQLADVLGAAPCLRILATSRAPLRLYGEHEYPVPPLPLPTAGAPLEELTRSEAVRLFADRARAVAPSFSLDESNAQQVAAICRRLDGLPLALELAAARSKLLRPAAMLDRLDDLPPTGPRDAPARQRTLAATIEWSYDLLGSKEQLIFVELGVFTGGCTIDAAEIVCNAGLDALASLVDNSLLRQREGSDGAPRFTMLETVRRFATDRLDGHDVRRRHANWMVELAEAAQAHWLTSGDPVAWLDRIGDELDNARSALRWALDTGHVETALRLATALRTFWEVRGHFPEGGRWIEEALARDDHVPPQVRGKALSVAGTIAFRTGDLTRAGERYEEGLEIWRKLDDTGQIARSLSDVGTVAAGVGEFETARKLLDESAVVFREIGEDKRLAIVLSNLGHVAGELRDYETAIEVSKEALAIEEQLGRTPNKAITLMNLGTYAQESGDNDGARGWLRRCLSLAVELKYTELMAYALGVAVRLSVAEREFERAARLAGVTDGLLEDAGVPLQTTEEAKFEAAKTAARDRLGDEAYEAAHAAGRAADAVIEASLF